MPTANSKASRSFYTNVVILAVSERETRSSTCFYDKRGVWGSIVVKALRYYSDGPEIDSRWCHWIFH